MNFEDLRGLFHRQSSEIPHLYNLRFPLIKRGKFLQRLIECEQLVCTGLRHGSAFVQGYPDRVSAAFPCAPLAGVIDHDPTHKLRGGSKKMDTVLPARMRLVRELEVSVVQKRSRLQGVIGSLPPHVMLRDTLQLWLHKRD
jgi:hypothetical protein